MLTVVAPAVAELFCVGVADQIWAKEGVQKIGNGKRCSGVCMYPPEGLHGRPFARNVWSPRESIFRFSATRVSSSQTQRYYCRTPSHVDWCLVVARQPNTLTIVTCKHPMKNITTQDATRERPTWRQTASAYQRRLKQGLCNRSHRYRRCHPECSHRRSSCQGICSSIKQACARQAVSLRIFQSEGGSGEVGKFGY